jgi:putative Ca2+/H+ antiporter (TMEM165/GDT1 family)
VAYPARRFFRHVPGETFGFDRSFAGAEGRRAIGHAFRPRIGLVLDILLVTIGTVALAELGDKTQLLALMLAVRYGRPMPVIAGILVATLANHALAAGAGTLLGGLFDGSVFRWLVGLSFLAMAGWILIPDVMTHSDAQTARWGPFLATTAAFFIVEIGDKTQIATIALAARFESWALVTAGTTVGMMLANVPVVFLGDRVAGRIPARTARIAAACLFAFLGLLTLFGFGPTAGGENAL